MSKTTFKGSPVDTTGEFPKVGEKFPFAKLIKTDLSELEPKDLAGKKVVFNVFPSIDTPVCAAQLRQFSTKLQDRDDVVLLFASLDLPFALNRFCAAEGIKNAIPTSDFKNKELAEKGMLMQNGVLQGLYARGVLITDEHHNIVHSELCADVANEPDYEAAIKHV